MQRTGALATGAATLRYVPASAQPPSVAGTTTGAATVSVRLVVNGHGYDLQLDPRVTLLDALREHIGLTGTKKGCDRGQCGACTVLVDGRRINSCLALAVMHGRERITTIEGLALGGSLHPMQTAFVRHDGFQCGFCTPGQICSAVAMLDEVAAGAPSAATRDVKSRSPVELTAAEVRERMSGNLCRCGAYPSIVRAVLETAAREQAAR